jgi:hypothetical protein
MNIETRSNGFRPPQPPIEQPKWRIGGELILMLVINIMTAVFATLIVLGPGFLKEAGKAPVSGLRALALISIHVALSFAALVILLHRSRLSLAHLGLARPPQGYSRAILAGIGYAVISLLITSAVSALQKILFGWESQLEQIELGNLMSTIGFVLVGWLKGGFWEEVLWRGYFITRLQHLFGLGRFGTAISIAIPTILFGLFHSYQGIAGVISTMVMALVMTAAYFLSRRNLFPLIVAHGAHDMAGIIVIALGILG